MADREQEVPFPKFNIEDDKGNPCKPVQAMENGQFAYTWETVTPEGIYEWLRVMESLFPQMPELKAMQTYLKPVCVESVLDPYVYHLFSLEAAVQAYGTTALSLRQDLFSIFEVIRASGNQFETLQNFEREQEFKSQETKSKR